jgi:hypothetical protein
MVAVIVGSELPSAMLVQRRLVVWVAFCKSAVILNACEWVGVIGRVCGRKAHAVVSCALLDGFLTRCSFLRRINAPGCSAILPEHTTLAPLIHSP